MRGEYQAEILCILDGVVEMNTGEHRFVVSSGSLIGDTAFIDVRCTCKLSSDVHQDRNTAATDAVAVTEVKMLVWDFDTLGKRATDPKFNMVLTRMLHSKLAWEIKSLFTGGSIALETYKNMLELAIATDVISPVEKSVLREYRREHSISKREVHTVDMC